MTEKRFIIDDAGTLIDMQTRNTYEYVSDVCPLLNALNDENEQLKHDATVLIQANQDYRKENEQLKSENIELTVDNKELKNTNIELNKENEQLKKQIERIDFILDDLNGAEYISRDDGIKALNKIDKVIGKR